jgi:hypothetical protein
MTSEQLTAIRERCDAATNGPWEWLREDADNDYSRKRLWNPHSSWILTARYTARRAGVTRTYVGVKNLADWDFTAHARQDVPDLLAEVERLQERCEKTERMVKHLVGIADEYQAGIERARRIIDVQDSGTRFWG